MARGKATLYAFLFLLGACPLARLCRRRQHLSCHTGSGSLSRTSHTSKSARPALILIRRRPISLLVSAPRLPDSELLESCFRPRSSSHIAFGVVCIRSLYDGTRQGDFVSLPLPAWCMPARPTLSATATHFLSYRFRVLVPYLSHIQVCSSCAHSDPATAHLSLCVRAFVFSVRARCVWSGPFRPAPARRRHRPDAFRHRTKKECVRLLLVPD